MIIKSHQFKSSTQEETNKDKDTSFQLQSFYSRVNDTPLADLSLVDSVIFDKTGTMTIPQFKLKMISINDQIYNINNKTFVNKTNWKSIQK